MSVMLSGWLQVWQARLQGEDCVLDLRLLVESVTGLSLTAQRLQADYPLDAAQLARLDAWALRRAQGEPLAYILGHQPFYDLDLRVTPATLIPRPDTEILVEAALARLPSDVPCTVADLGTGSGAIALAIARHRPRARVLAVDVSADALRVARDNARRHGIGNCHFLQASWLDGLADGAFDMVVSNPPYIAADDAHLPALSFEPRTALVAADNGLADIRRIAQDAPRVLKADGWLLFEHGYDQREALAALPELHWAQRDFLRDYGGNWRVCVCRIQGLNDDFLPR